MARAPVDRRDERRRSRENYRREFERRQAEKQGRLPKIQPFQPEKFIAQIRTQSWATIHTVLFSAGVTAAFVLGGRALGAPGSFAFLALLGIGSLFYYLLRFWDIDLRRLGKVTSQIGVFFTYFITWVMVSFLLSNPPVFDGVAPELVCCGFYIPAKAGSTGANHTFPEVLGNWSLGVPVQGTPGTYTVNASDNETVLEFGAFDGGGVSRVTLAWDGPHGASDETNLSVTPNGKYHHRVPNLEANTSWTFAITVVDFVGHVSFARGTVNVACDQTTHGFGLC